MTTIFGIDVAAEVADAIPEGDAPPATLISIASGTRTPGSPSAGTNPTSTSYPCRGFVTDYTAFQRQDTSIEDNDREFRLVGKSIDGGAVKPKPNDVIIDEDGRSYSVVRVRGNSAVWVLQARG